jgi:uracil-DNA glycosylase
MKSLEIALERHRQALSGCRRCALCADVRPIVSRARAPRVMLVGQAPGKTEAGGGKPFAGRAGRTLFGWLGHAGIDEHTAREQIYIAAVTRCYPGPSPSGRGDRVPGPSERANCSTWLDGELRIIRPRLIIPVGRLAIDALVGTLPLDEVVGREFRVEPTGADPTVAIPLPHPSGASSWIHAPGHRDLLDRALRRIGRRWHALQKLEAA